KKHSWENTELDDFMNSLSEQSGIDLDPWAQDWMYQAGVNTIEARFSCDSNGISSFAILQTVPDDYPTLRDQRVQLGLFTTDANGSIELNTAIPIEIFGAETQVPEAIGLDCPNLALPNYEGWGYTEVSLDEVSMDTIISDNAIERIDDPLMRSMIWTALFDAPGNGQMENSILLETLIASLPVEENDRIIRQTMATLVGNLNLLERLGGEYANELAEYGPQAEQQLWRLISAGVSDEAGSQSLSTLNLRLSRYIGLARSFEALGNLASLLEDVTGISGLSLGQNQRWNIIQRFTARDYDSARELLAAERERDPSDAGRRSAIAAEAGLPDLNLKREWVTRILDTENPLPLSNLRAAMGSIFPTGQEELQLALLPQLTSNLSQLASSRDNYFQQTYGRDLFSGICEQQGLEILSTAISDSDAIGATLYRFMSENVQSASQCLELKD
ncbi:MAG: aminopeptidase N, partial [Kiritimatiellia bacterium]